MEDGSARQDAYLVVIADLRILRNGCRSLHHSDCLVVVPVTRTKQFSSPPTGMIRKGGETDSLIP